MQQEKLITDTFTLIALVIRDRVGRFQQPADKLWDELLRIKDLQVFLFSSFGIVCSILTGWLLWFDPTGSTDPKFTRSDQTLSSLQSVDQTRFVGVVMLQIGLSISTFATCVLLYQKYKLHVDEKRRIWSGMDMKQLTISQLSPDTTPQQKMTTLMKFKAAYNFWQSDLRFKLAGEVLVHILHPVIFLNEPSTQALFRILEIFIFARLYMIIKLVYVFSNAYASREEVLSSNVELRRTGSPITMLSTLKMLLFSHPTTVTLCMMMLILAVSGFIMFLAERTTQPQVYRFGDLENCYWFTFVTFATIGYGDLVPQSQFARLVSVFIGASGVTTVIIFNGIITNLMVQSREQRFVAEYLQLVDSTRESRMAAARVIQCAWKFYRANRGLVVTPWHFDGHKTNYIHKNIKKFQRTRWHITRSLSTANDPVIDTKMNDVRDDLEKMCFVLDKRERGAGSTVDNVIQITDDLLRLIQKSKRKF